jgi:aarF domain-containing kinase
VLTETFEEGVPVSQLVANYPEAVCKRAGVIICDLYLRMLFAHNFSHGDMHPGNILVTGADSVETVGVTLLDAGIVTHLDDADQVNFIDLFRSIMSRDGRRAGELMLERSRSQRCEDPEAFVSGIEALVDEALSAGLMLENLKVGQLLMRVLTLSCSNRVGLETNFTSVAIAIMVLEALGRSLNPQQDILKAARPYLVKRQLGII